MEADLVERSPAATVEAADGAVAASPRRFRLAVAPGWRGMLREVAVIAAGALAALGAQAWWQDRQDRERERDYLRQLLVDTRENERRLDNAIRSDSVTRLALGRLAVALYEPGPVPPDDTLQAVFSGRAFSASDFQPISGTASALLTTGDLRLVRTDSLRIRLIAFAATLEYERDNLRFYQSQAFGDADRLGRALPVLYRVFLDGVPRALVSRAEFAQLRQDRDMSGMMFALMAANANRITLLPMLREATGRLRRALEAEHGLAASPAPR